MSTETRHLVEASQTLGGAFLAGFDLRAICQRGTHRGPVKIEPCGYAANLHLETLIWAKGAKYPCWRLINGRLRCPRCGGLSVELAWLPPVSPNAGAARSARDLHQCQVAAREL